LRLRAGTTPLWPFNILELKTFLLAKLRTSLLQVYKEQCKKYDTLSMFHRHCSLHRTLVVMFNLEPFFLPWSPFWKFPSKLV
jgi:hypothetical protein